MTPECIHIFVTSHYQWLTIPSITAMSVIHLSSQGRERIEEEDLYAAMENKAVESYSEITGSPKPGQDAGVPDPIPQALKRAVAVYEAGKALIAYITPDFEEIARVGGLWS